MPPLSLKKRIFKAGGWTLAGFAVSQTIRLASTLIVTRLLAPEMFGVVAIASVVMMVLHMMSDLGIHHNIVQNPRGEEVSFLNTAWTLQILRGFLLWFVAMFVAAALHLAVKYGLVASTSVYADAELPWIIAVSASSAAISGFQTTEVALAHRRLDQSRLVRMELAGQIVGFAVTVAAAWAARSIWALVVGGIASNITTLIIGHRWIGTFKNRLHWESSAVRELISFGKWAFASSVFTVLSVNGDRLLLGAFVEAEYLGLYAVAMLLLGAMEAVVAGMLSAVSLPALSEVARTAPHRLRDVYYKLRIPSDTLLLLASGTLFNAGTALVEVLYDPRYAPAGAILQVLALSFFAARYNVSYQIYLALGKPRYLALINLVRCISMFVVVPLAFSTWGTEAAVWAIALHGLAMMPLVLAFNHRFGVLDIRKEALLLLAFPVGVVLGRVVEAILLLGSPS